MAEKPKKVTKKKVKKDMDRHPVTVTIDTPVYDEVGVIAGQYNALKGPQIKQGVVATVAIQLFLTYPWVYQHEMIDRRNNPAFWAAYRKKVRREAPFEWPDDTEPDAETPGKP